MSIRNWSSTSSNYYGFSCDLPLPSAPSSSALPNPSLCVGDLCHTNSHTPSKFSPWIIGSNQVTWQQQMSRTYFKGEIVSFLGPEILLALTFGPTAGSSTTTQIVQHGRFPRFETWSVHKATDGTVLVVAHSLDDVVHHQRLFTVQAAGRHAALTRRRPRCHND